MELKFKKSESFYIRDGWIEKSINAINDEQCNIFYKNDGIKYLGIGSNMVKGLKYWLKAATLIDGKENELTEFAKLLLDYDKYLDTSFSWFLIHYFLSSDREECPIFNEFFNSNLKQFTRSSLTNYLVNEFNTSDGKVNQKYVEADVAVFINSYVNEDVDSNPEDNYRCPLSRLKLIRKDKEGYTKTSPKYNDLSCLIVLYVLCELYADKDSFEIEESLAVANSPAKIFNLDKYMYLQYLDELRRNGLITINKTAGLNTVYFEKKMSLEDIFKEEFGD